MGALDELGGIRPLRVWEGVIARAIEGDRPSLAVIIDRVPQARARIEAAQAAIVAAVRARDAKGAAEWMARHVRDFRRGYEVAGIPLSTEVGDALRDGPGVS